MHINPHGRVQVIRRWFSLSEGLRKARESLAAVFGGAWASADSQQGGEVGSVGMCQCTPIGSVGLQVSPRYDWGGTKAKSSVFYILSIPNI